MNKKIITTVLLLSFVNYLIGCYYTEQVSKEEKINETDKITEVVFPSGDFIKFDSNGAHLVSLSSVISGISNSGDYLNVGIDAVKEIRTKVYPEQFNPALPGKIKTLITKDRREYNFENNSPVINKTNNTITWKNLAGKELEIKIDEIDYVYVIKPETITLADLYKNNNIKVRQVLIINNTVTTFDSLGGKYFNEKNLIKGISVTNVPVEIDPEEILYVNVEKTDVVKTCLISLGGVVAVAGVIFLIALATKESCPFIYSFDGDKYVFDAEPLGGATAKVLEREDYSRLENLKNVDGKYKLRIANEVDETQFIDRIQLIVVDHPFGTEMIYNNDGNSYIVKNPYPLFYATDENGTNINKFFEKDDNICWQSNMRSFINNNENIIRHKLTLAFPKPIEADSVKLIINAGTTLWGSNMIKEMLMLYGNEIDNWYEKINQKGIEFEQMMNFLRNEELFELKIYVNEKEGWKEKAIIQGGGPFKTEKRIIELDVSNVQGDTLFLQINPPVGFWSFDYTAVEYDYYNKPDETVLEFISAIDHAGENVGGFLNAKDENYYSLPETGDYLNLEFEAPRIKEGLDRTVFVKTAGYYQIHLPKTGQPDYQLLYQFVTNSGKIVEFSTTKYEEWLNQISYNKNKSLE